MKNDHSQLPFLLDISELMEAGQGAKAGVAIWAKEVIKVCWVCKAFLQEHKLGSPLPSPL